MCWTVICIAALTLADAPSPEKSRPPHELRSAVRQALQRSAPSRKPDPHQMAPELIALLDEIRGDSRMHAGDRRRYEGLLKGRLKTFADKLEAQQAQPEAAPRPQHVALPEQDAGNRAILAQQGAFPGQGGAGGFVGGGQAGRNARGFPPRDNSQELIDLIKRTIAPSTWDDAGGQGTIRYYRPLQVLVIRQTGEIHGQLGGLFNGMRK